ncbi:MAG: Stk1 family PASTA domain-containing Ser/Thr kinase [Eubacteriales bacterium]|nr:Stk1 family PASTA domain-containing Ser/Thr kinase [Eubacteriales bacterium]MDD3863634.1 Stk1 family PASTA domain-containing Ser/Thr kinase [Eubacteriales bacterium]
MGSRILAGRYELAGKIGEGGMAVVFKARDRLLNRQVAIKILKPEFTKDVVFIESFRRESQTAAGLVHPNIVNVYDVGKEGNIYYIVMELIDGKPLSQIIKEEGPLDPRRAATITRQVASALAAAHKHQLIHRDVKPHNIMLTSEGVAKITDFGIAKAISTGTLVGSQQEAVMGSVHYFSPEQARGGYVDEKSDIYALGIVLYEMLTGKVPFDGENAVAVAVKHMNEAMVPPSRHNPDIPADLEEIVMRATSKLQINRYKSAEEIITALNFVKYSKPVAGLATESGRSAAGNHSANRAAAEESPTNEEGAAIRQSGAANGKKKSKSKKKVVFHPEKLAIIILALALAVPASGMIYKAILGATAPDDVKVPDLVGLTQEEAAEALSPAGLLLDIDMELPSNIYEEGEIMSQTPKAEAVVKPGITIRVNVSKGQVDGAVPSVEGKPLSGAKYILETYGYRTGSVSETHSDTVPAGIVISQNPARGTVLANGGSVSLQVSLGPEFGEFEVIDLRGKPLNEATLIIESMGLSLGAITYVDNPSVEENSVISHSPGPGTTVTEPIEVDLVVSKADAPVDPANPPVEPEDEQNSVAITLDFSLADKEEFLLTVNVADGVFDPRTPINKEPRSRADGTEVISVSGAGRNGVVKIWYDNELVYDLTVDFLSREVE